MHLTEDDMFMNVGCFHNGRKEVLETHQQLGQPTLNGVDISQHDWDNNFSITLIGRVGRYTLRVSPNDGTQQMNDDDDDDDDESTQT